METDDRVDKLDGSKAGKIQEVFFLTSVRVCNGASSRLSVAACFLCLLGLWTFVLWPASHANSSRDLEDLTGADTVDSRE